MLGGMGVGRIGSVGDRHCEAHSCWYLFYRRFKATKESRISNSHGIRLLRGTDVCRINLFLIFSPSQ